MGRYSRRTDCCQTIAEFAPMKTRLGHGPGEMPFRGPLSKPAPMGNRSRLDLRGQPARAARFFDRVFSFKEDLQLPRAAPCFWQATDCPKGRSGECDCGEDEQQEEPRIARRQESHDKNKRNESEQQPNRFQE